MSGGGEELVLAHEDPLAGVEVDREDVAHAVETIVTQGPGSFLSEIQLRPLRKA